MEIFYLVQLHVIWKWETPVSLELATKASFGGEKSLKIYILSNVPHAKTEEWNQKTRGFSDKSGILLPGSDTYFPELSAHVSLKGSTKGSFRGSKIQIFRCYYTFSSQMFSRSRFTRFNKSSYQKVSQRQKISEDF